MKTRLSWLRRWVLTQSIPSEHLPYPWWRRLAYRWLLIPLGHLCGWGYWSIRHDKTACFMDWKLRDLFGVAHEPCVEPYSDALFRLDEASAGPVREMLEFARAHEAKVKMPLLADGKMMFFVGWVQREPWRAEARLSYGFARIVPPTRSRMEDIRLLELANRASKEGIRPGSGLSKLASAFCGWRREYLGHARER